MKKGIIAAIVVAICAMLAATYAFAAPGKAEKKDVKKEVTTTEKKKETTTAEKPKTETKESEELNIEETEISTEEESDIENAEEVSDDQEESDDSEEIDDEEMDHCNHEWVQTGYAADPDFQTGYAIEQECKKCHLCKGIEISQEEFEEATKEDQESYADEGCEYEDSEDVEVVE